MAPRTDSTNCLPERLRISDAHFDDLVRRVSDLTDEASLSAFLLALAKSIRDDIALLLEEEGKEHLSSNLVVRRIRLAQLLEDWAKSIEAN